MQNPDNTNNSEDADFDLPGEIELGEKGIVKADPEDFQEQDENQFVNNLVEDHLDFRMTRPGPTEGLGSEMTCLVQRLLIRIKVRKLLTGHRSGNLIMMTSTQLETSVITFSFSSISVRGAWPVSLLLAAVP